MSPTFLEKKARILADISTHESNDYTDKSPKGTIDAEIIDLINEINAFEGYVTTSSCAGRVAVFVEGHKTAKHEDEDDANGVAEGGEDAEVDGALAIATAQVKAQTGPGGKGLGNRWLYVSHAPVPVPMGIGSETKQTFHEMFGLTPQSSSYKTDYPNDPNVRLIKLVFSPLILHILCSSLRTAKPLLAAAINAGFRESGLQSLKALDEERAGFMVAVRTAGVGFESVVGWVEGERDREEVYRSCVAEGVLGMWVGVANGRFWWNEGRRERLRGELKMLRRRDKRGGTKHNGWEDKEVRRRRKREEGLRVRMEKEELEPDKENRTDADGQEQRDAENLEDAEMFLDVT